MASWSDQTTLDGEASQEPSGGSSRETDADLGRRIGPYRIERLIARGGMGRVYLAIREDDYEQQVALKLLDREEKTLGQIDLFYRERQILAGLQHPGIARILDGGTTFDGFPYFVMEYVEGEHVDRFCDRRAWDLGARLRLVQQICGIVQFFHQNLVIHKDLKPSNILVTPEGQPKLLDFGIAEILEETPQDRLTAGPLTPGYASPEQLIGDPITTASDIYSLGVLLYQLVCGRPPYRLKGLDLRQLGALVASAEVPPPSQVAPPAASRALRGDIDAIVMKAISRRPEARYASAAQLGEDIQRHLADLPIKAHAGTWRQRAAKSLRRHKLSYAVAFLIVGFSIVTTVFWRQAVHRGNVAELARAEAEAAQNRAELSLRRKERISELLKDIFTSGNPDAGDLSVREVLDRGSQRLLTELADDPNTRADLLSTLGTVYNNLSLYEEARDLKEESLRVLQAADDPDPQELAVALNNLSRLLYDLGDYPAAEKYLRDALTIWIELDDEPRTLLARRNLAALLTQTGKPDEALAIHEQILTTQKRLHGAADLEVAESLYSQAILRRTLGQLDEAERLLRGAEQIFVGELGEGHSRVAAVLSSLGRVLHAQGRLPEARRSFERALALRLELLGDDHVQVANTAKNFAALLLEQGEIVRAGELLEKALVTLRSKKPAGHIALADAESLFGEYLVAVGQYPDAEPLLLTSYQILRDAKGEDHALTRHSHDRVLGLYRAWDNEEKARAFAGH